ncbi:hypothetical protein SAMN05421823_11951 [Catalinimonas alkaloidigena]|uniref:DUF1854 domain-containing protein n=1 Tax=Catalinimonas alkaloidigena TaxID=1075417 RepID=A0A1G9V8I4_9BACT|nr:hypothetical protein [Catalinimonas alkaloidigena]SDM68484.1 hypothetical protein SAMN05421823_11951 [Catalinimonas alkaloidigena]
MYQIKLDNFPQETLFSEQDVRRFLQSYQVHTPIDFDLADLREGTHQRRATTIFTIFRRGIDRYGVHLEVEKLPASAPRYQSIACLTESQVREWIAPFLPGVTKISWHSPLDETGDESWSRSDDYWEIRKLDKFTRRSDVVVCLYRDGQIRIEDEQIHVTPRWFFTLLNLLIVP